MIRALVLLSFWGICILIVGPPLVLWAVLTGDVNPLYRIATWLAITGVRVVGVDIEVRGTEHIQPGRNYIFMSNHVSNLDPAILIPSIPGRCSVLVKKELFRTPIFGTGMKLASLVPVDRSDREAAIESVNAAIRVLRQGLHLVTFPEGTRSADGSLLPFKKGPFHLAMDSGVPVMPVTILGSYDCWPKTRFALRAGKVSVVFHPPIDPATFVDRDSLMHAVARKIASVQAPEHRRSRTN